MKIKVIDSIMGSGKTSKIMEFMENGDDRYIYITPFLSEVKRIKEGITSKRFYEPTQRGKGKMNSMLELVKNGKNIVSTHALFATADEELMELLNVNNYTLILDEVMNVIETVNISKDDLKMLVNDNNMKIEEDGKVVWINDEYSGDFDNIKIMAQHNRLIMANKNLMLWRFPVDVFSCFNEVYILTYMFNGQIMKYYYDLYDAEYEYMSISKKDGEFKFVPLEDGKSSIVDLIDIEDNEKLNKIGNDEYSLSYSWYKTSRDSMFDVLRRNVTNFFRYKNKAKSKDILWTTFLGSDDEYRKAIQNKGYQSARCFAPVNARATNDYADRAFVAYTVNRFLNPYLKNFFISKGIAVNEDMYALSELLQFLFRSAIRKGNKIKLYIPSSRMRNLLLNWIEGCDN